MMKTLITLVLAVLGVAHAGEAYEDDSECYEVDPTRWHLLPPNPESSDGRSGLVLAEVGHQLFTLQLESEDYHTQYLAQFPYHDICNSTEFKWSAAEQHFPDDKSGKIEFTFPCMYMLEDGSGFLTCGEKMKCSSHVYLECGSDSENTTEPDWELSYAGLNYLDPETNEIITGGSEGILGVAVQDRNNPENYGKGTVCDDSFNSHAANLSCQYLGFDYAARWGSKPDNSKYIPEELLEKYDVPIVVGWVYCDNTSSHITECEASIMESHECSRSNNLWLQCQDFKEWAPIDAGLFTVDNKTGELEAGNEGLLLVTVAYRDGYDNMISLNGTVCDDSFNDHAANLACQYLGYKYADDWGSGSKYVPDSYLEQHGIPIVIDDLYCDEWKTSIMECEANVMEKHDCMKDESLWLKCSHGEEKDPVWDLASAALLTYDPESDGMKIGREGLLGVTFEDRNQQEEPLHGTVCGTSFNYHTADLACQYLGYDYAQEWGTDPQNSKYIPTHFLEKHGVQIVVSDVECDKSNYNITECGANVMGRHNCSRSENLWLKCAERGNDWKPIAASLLSFDEKTGNVIPGSEGLLLVGLENSDGGFIHGTVCYDSFNSHAANLGCQYLGYEYAEDWGSGFKYFPESVLEAAGLEIVIDDLYCDEGKKEIMECEANIMEKHDCSKKQNLWLKCSDEEEKKLDWDLVSATLYKYDPGSGEVRPNRGEGLLAVTLTDLIHEEMDVQGTVCGTSFNYQEANLACKYLGHDYVKDWGTDPQNSNYVPEWMLEEYGIPIVVDGVRCDENASSIKDCDANIMEAHKCSRKENLWLKCISEDDEEEEEEEEEQGIELEFGGAKLKLNLSKFRGKLLF